MTSHSQKDLASLKKLFALHNQNIVILGHTHPDGDAVGAGLALQEFLQQKGHKVSFILPDPYPDFLSWMPLSDGIFIHTKQQEKCEKLIKLSDLIIFVDMNSPSRLESFEKAVTEQMLSKTSILLDHHINPDSVFTFKYWDTEVSSTSELVYELIGKLGESHLINKTMAENLYAGIITDTGSFSYSCNNPATYIAVSRLIEIGVDGAWVHQQIYNTFTEDRLRLLGHSLSEKLKVLKKYGGAYIALNQYDLVKYKYNVGDTEGLVNYTLSIKGIHFGALLTQYEQYIKISLRSEGDIDVNYFARRYFNGGGHKNAAGAYYYGPLDEACKVIESIIRKHIKLEK